MLPDAMAKLPLPTYLIFGLLFFTATVISGSTGAIAMGTPLAFAAIPGGAITHLYERSVLSDIIQERYFPTSSFQKQRK